MTPIIETSSQLYERSYSIRDIDVSVGPRGCREFVRDSINQFEGVNVDGYIQRVVGNDIKLVIRGTLDHLNVLESNFLSHQHWSCRLESSHVYLGRLRESKITILHNQQGAIPSDRSPREYN
jgi:hypothetical protein